MEGSAAQVAHQPLSTVVSFAWPPWPHSPRGGTWTSGRP